MKGRNGVKAVITPKVTEQICDAIKKAGTLRMADHLKLLPYTLETINKLRENDEFNDAINKARAIGYENLIDESLVIAFSNKDDMITLESGKTILNHNAVQRDKLKIDTIFRRVSKANPALYSDTYYKSTGRKIRCEGFAKAKTAADKYNIICEALSKGEISLEAATTLSSLCDFQAKQEELKILEDRIKALEKETA